MEDDKIQHMSARFYIHEEPTTSNVDDLHLADTTRSLSEQINAFCRHNSSWITLQIKYLWLFWGSFRPLDAGFYIPTLKFIELKRAVVNVRSFDCNCFQYSILARMKLGDVSQQQHKNRLVAYTEHMHLLNMNGIQTPVKLSSISKFERQNPDISVDVLYLDDNNVVPISMSKFCNQRNYHINFLMVFDDEKFHCTSIQQISRLVGNQTKHKAKSYLSLLSVSIHPRRSPKGVKEHLPICSQHELQQVVYPKPGKNILNLPKFSTS